jgi:hypothetical protein
LTALYPIEACGFAGLRISRRANLDGSFFVIPTCRFLGTRVKTSFFDTMKTKLTLYSLFLAISGGATLANAQSTAFTYQGRLNLDGAPVNGPYDFRFSIYTAGAGGSLVAGALPLDAVDVVRGLFVTRLDFGIGVFTGPARWLEVSVRPAGNGNFRTLDQRLELTSSPYSIRAQAASIADNIAAGSVVKSLNGLKDDVILAPGTNVLFTLNGNTVTVAAAGAGGSGIWSVNGNNAYYASGKVGIGTPNPAAALEVRGDWDGVNGALTLSGAAPTLRLAGDGSTGNNSWLLQVGADGNLGFYNKALLTPFGLVTTITPLGYVGLGTASPQENLSIAGVATYNSGLKLTGSTTAGTGLALANTAGGGHQYALFSGGSATGVGAGGFGIYDDTSGAYRLAIDANGNVGIGKRNPQSALDVAGDVKGTRLLLRADPLAAANAAVLCDDPNVVNFVPYNTANGRPLSIIARDATVRQVTITGGADLAEPFAINHEGVSPGSVVVIDEKSPGSLRLSTQAYDRRVAGVVSGANGIKPGISLHQEGAIEGGENVALSGRVYVQADAAFGTIEPGDLLTTSDTPGHAMKVIDYAKAQGAILGKAMSGLKESKGMVLVLVALQ